MEGNDSMRKRGFTLVELVIGVSLMTMVIALGFQIMSASNKITAKTINETQLQSSARLFTENINTSVRYASAIFMIPKKSFVRENLTKGWSYLGIWDNVEISEKIGNTENTIIAPQAIVHIEYQPNGRPAKVNEGETIIENDGSFFVQKVFGYTKTDPVTGNLLKYSLVFDKNDATGVDTNLNYSLTATLLDKDGNVVNNKHYLDIKTELEALNSLQVINKGAALNPATAIAYRKDDRADETVAHVAMVLDTSGSMQWDMNGDSYDVPEDKKRISILKEKSKEFVDSLSSNESIEVGIIPFSYFGNMELNAPGTSRRKKIFQNAKYGKEELHQYIDGLIANGATNTGDGMRYAYHELKDINDKNVNNYLLLLVDGDTTSWTLNEWSDYDSYYTGPGNREFCGYFQFISYDSKVQFFRQVGAREMSVYSFRPLTYVGEQAVYENLIDGYVKEIAKKYTSYDFAKVYVIIFANSVTSRGVQTLKDAFVLDNENLFKATDEEKLHTAFEEIGKDIKKEMWYLNGPKL